MRVEALVEAQPRTQAEISSLPACPDVTEAAIRRDISEIVHFTTLPNGATGILVSGTVRCRNHLNADQYLERVYAPNALDRTRDRRWHDYINMSVSRINGWMFSTSERWHASDGVSWILLSFSPEILGHPGVVFATTNNAYVSVRRAEGALGFERLFGDSVVGAYGNLVRREATLNARYTTDRQAEVLYPFDLGLDHLQRIYVQTEAALDSVEGLLGVSDRQVEVRQAPEVFQ